MIAITTRSSISVNADRRATTSARFGTPGFSSQLHLADWSCITLRWPNAKLTDDEERASDARIGSCG